MAKKKFDKEKFLEEQGFRGGTAKPKDDSKFVDAEKASKKKSKKK